MGADHHRQRIEPVTVQLTPKKYKAMKAGAVALAIVGAVGLIVAPTSSGQMIAGPVFALGIILFIAARIGAWWSSG